MKRLTNIDIAKGIGILLVVLDHCYPIENPLNNWICSFHMPLFLILTGMLYGIRVENGGKPALNLSRKIRTIVIPYFIWSVVHRIFVIGTLQVIGGTSVWDMLRSSLVSILTFASGPTWFLSTLLFAEIVFFFFRSDKMRICAAIVLGLFGLLVPKFGDHSHQLFRTLLAFTYISVGYYLHKPLLRKGNLFTLFICAVLSIRIGTANGDVFLSSRDLGNPFFFAVTSFTGSYLVIRISSALDTYFSKASSFLAYLGENSILILCLHDIALELLRLLDAKTFYTLSNPNLLNGFLLAVVTVLILLPAILFCNRYLYWTFGKPQSTPPSLKTTCSSSNTTEK